MLHHCVQRRHDRRAHASQHGKQEAAGGTAEDAELVLYAQHVDVELVENIRGGLVRGEVILIDHQPHARRVGIRLPVVHGDDQDLGFRPRLDKCVSEVVREDGDAALAR
jgi:hypothetical protein